MKILFLVAVLFFAISTQALCQTAEGYVEDGNSLLAHNKSLQAESRYLLALELNPQMGEAHQRLGDIYQGRKKYPAAITHYKKALSLQAGHPTTYINLAFCLQRSGKLDEAIDIFRVLIAKYPELPEAYLGLGGLYELQGLNEKAESAYADYRAYRHQPSR